MNSLVFYTRELDSPFSGWLRRKAAVGFMGRLTIQCFSTLRCKDDRVQKFVGNLLQNFSLDVSWATISMKRVTYKVYK